MHLSTLLRSTAMALILVGPLVARAQPPRLEFTRMVAHWDGYADPDYLAFIDDARPEVVQVGFYGAHFWSLAHTPFGGGYPAHFPVRGLDECGNWFEELNGQLHRRRAKVVGHFNVEFLVGDPDGPEGPRGFFQFYRDLWNEQVLGPRPTDDPLELLQKGPDGLPIIHHSYQIGGMSEYWGCLNNPKWRDVLKAWVRVALRRGVDGFIGNYLYRHNCLCDHCVQGFRCYLADRFTADELRERFEIVDLEHHEFREIVGWHDPAKSSPLLREMLRFSQISVKRAFDEVFRQFGRSLKSDLIVAQWDHLGDFAQIAGDERCLLPARLWGRGEDYLWYSTGSAACFTDLAAGILGEGTLQARYIRGAFDDKPFTLGKYESTRIRVAIAELAANGGAPMGFYARFRDPEARTELVRYYRFLRENDALYHANRPHAEAVLLYPRRRLHEGDVSAVERFKQVGRCLLERHVLFDVLPDHLATPDHRPADHRIVTVADGLPGDLDDADLSRFEAPTTVRVSASRPLDGGELTVHFVNYDRDEPDEPRSPGTGIADDRPRPVSGIEADLRLPEGSSVTEILALSPEWPEPRSLPFVTAGGRVRFGMPEFLVYGVARVRLDNPPAQAAEPDKPVKELILPGESFLVAGRPAFILWPSKERRRTPQPWVLYSPTLPPYPDRHEKWMHQQFLDAGVAVAGIDVGESYGSPRGRELFTALYRELTEKRGFAPRPCLLGRSRGGLWNTSWAEDHPDWVAGLSGIYPVFDLRSYPGLAKAAPAYELTAAQFEDRLPEVNPIERVDVLAKHHIPAFLIHGDADEVVPLNANSAAFVSRYRAAGAGDLVRLVVVEGQGHNLWEGFFHCQELIDFTIERAQAGARPPTGR